MIGEKMAKIFKRIALVVLLTLVGGGISYYLTHQKSTPSAIEQGPIVDYNEVRDRADILKIFVEEKHWLLSSDDYDADFMLKYKAPNENPLYFGKAHIKSYLENGQFAGFSVYYKKTPNEGTILFIAVKPEFRNRGIAKKLTQAAIDDLKRLGSSRVTILTRTQNVRAQAVYTKLGFHEINRDSDGYVYYDMDVSK
jgi:ribosomal protein S18 acetylase RimI-like enzyme